MHKSDAMGRGYRDRRFRLKSVAQWVTLTEAAVLLSVRQEVLLGLVYSTSRTWILQRVIISPTLGKRIEYDLADLEKLVVEDAERRLE